MHVGFMVLTLVIGLAALVRGADVFVDGTGALAERLGISPVVVGLTVVAIGTSAPELAIAVTSAFSAADDLCAANVLGSNIVNTLLILGVTAVVAEVPVRSSIRRVEIPLAAGATALVLVLGLMDGVIQRVEAAAMLALFVGYLVRLVRSAKEKGREVAAEDKTGVLQTVGAAGAAGTGLAAGTALAVGTVARGPNARRLVLKSLLGAAAIALGAQLTVGSATDLAGVLGMDERLVGLTVIALGTSLPELVTSLAAARQGKTEIAVGNAVGSSLLNTLFVLGVSGAIRPVPFSANLLVDGMVAVASVVVLWALSRRGRLGRAGGATLLGGYALYCAHLLAA